MRRHLMKTSQKSSICRVAITLLFATRYRWQSAAEIARLLCARKCNVPGSKADQVLTAKTSRQSWFRLPCGSGHNGLPCTIQPGNLFHWRHTLKLIKNGAVKLKTPLQLDLGADKHLCTFSIPIRVATTTQADRDPLHRARSSTPS